MKHDADQPKSPWISNRCRDRYDKWNENHQHEGESAICGELGPVVMGVVGVERKILNGIPLVDLRKCSETVAEERFVDGHVRGSLHEFLANEVRIVLLEALPDPFPSNGKREGRSKNRNDDQHGSGGARGQSSFWIAQ